jgi:hypothetical protein
LLLLVCIRTLLLLLSRQLRSCEAHCSCGVHRHGCSAISWQLQLLMYLCKLQLQLLQSGLLLLLLLRPCLLLQLLESSLLLLLLLKSSQLLQLLNVTQLLLLLLLPTCIQLKLLSGIHPLQPLLLLPVTLLLLLHQLPLLPLHLLLLQLLLQPLLHLLQCQPSLFEHLPGPLCQPVISRM